MTNLSLKPEADFKKQARRLHDELVKQGSALPYMKCLDALAVQRGYRDWQHARVALRLQPPFVQADDSVLSQLHAAVREGLSSHARLVSKTVWDLVIVGDRPDANVSGGLLLPEEERHYAIVGCSAPASDGTTLGLGFNLEYCRKGDTVIFTGNTYFDIAREGTGETSEKSGLRIGCVDIGGIGSLPEALFTIDLAADSWQTDLVERISALPMYELLKEACLDGPYDSMEQLQEALGGSFSGWTAEDILAFESQFDY